MPSQQDEKRQAAREVIDILHEISILLVRMLSAFLFTSFLDGEKSKYKPMYLPSTFSEHPSRPHRIVTLRIADRKWRQSGGSGCKSEPIAVTENIAYDSLPHFQIFGEKF